MGGKSVYRKKSATGTLLILQWLFPHLCAYVHIWTTVIELSGFQRNKREHKVGRGHAGEALRELVGVGHRYTQKTLYSCKNII